MIHIRLTKDLAIQADKHQYMMCKRVKRKDGGEGWNPYYFFPHLDYLIDDLIEEKLHLSDATTFKQLLENQQKIKKEILEAVMNNENWTLGNSHKPN